MSIELSAVFMLFGVALTACLIAWVRAANRADKAELENSMLVVMQHAALEDLERMRVAQTWTSDASARGAQEYWQ